MDQPEKFILQWDQFETNFRNTFAGLRGEEHFADVTLVSEDGQLVKAHKVLLSATSPLFDTILKSQDHPKPLIFLAEVKMGLLNSLLEFIYCGEVEVTGDDLDKFMALANKLKVKGLIKDENLTNMENQEHDVEKERSKNSETKECESDQEMKNINMSAGDVDNIVGWEEGSLNTFNCNLCEKTSSTLKGLEKHKYRSHSVRKGKMPAELQETVFECDICHETSSSKRGLLKHKIIHH